MYHIFAGTPIIRDSYLTGTGGLFANAKTVTKPAAGKKGGRTEVVVAGISEKLEQFNTLKDAIAEKESRLRMIDGEIRDLAKEKFLELYAEEKGRPENFYLVGDKGGCLLVIAMDKYLMIKTEED